MTTLGKWNLNLKKRQFLNAAKGFCGKSVYLKAAPTQELSDKFIYFLIFFKCCKTSLRKDLRLNEEKKSRWIRGKKTQECFKQEESLAWLSDPKKCTWIWWKWWWWHPQICIYANISSVIKPLPGWAWPPCLEVLEMRGKSGIWGQNRGKGEKEGLDFTTKIPTDSRSGIYLEFPSCSNPDLDLTGISSLPQPWVGFTQNSLPAPALFEIHLEFLLCLNPD